MLLLRITDARQEVGITEAMTREARGVKKGGRGMRQESQEPTGEASFMYYGIGKQQRHSTKFFIT